MTESYVTILLLNSKNEMNIQKHFSHSAYAQFCFQQRGSLQIFLKLSFESGFGVIMHFLNILLRLEHFVCWFIPPWPSAELQLLLRELRWDTTSLKAHLCLLQCSILTDTGPHFLDEWTYLLSSSLRSNSLPTALQLQYLCWSAPENLSAYPKRIISINSLLQSLCVKRFLQRVFQRSNFA